MNALRRCALALALLLAASVPAAAVERIIQFVSDVVVQRDGELIVTETIQVEAEGNVIRRGIFRDFPTSYTRPDGTRVEVGFHVESVTRNRTAENFVIERLSNGYRVRIGSADRTVPRGQHTYVIRYRTTRQIGFFADYDELYWNVTGTGWVFPIDRAEARITLPESVPFRQTAVYTGPPGARGKDATIVEQQPGTIVFRTTRPLPAHNGLTVAAAWQKGVVEQPTAGRVARYWLEDNRALVIAVLGFLLLLAYYAYAWLRVGRDPPKGTIIPLFGPPDGMSPAATRYVDRMAFDNGCFSAAIINLGVKGHLHIFEKNDKTTLNKHSGDKPMASEEAALMQKLFAGKNNILLENTNHEPIGKAKTALGETLTKDYLGKLFTNNFGWSSFGLLLLVLLSVAVVLVAWTGHQHNIVPALVALSVFGQLFVMGGAAMVFNAWQQWPRKKGLLIGGLIMIGLAVGIGMPVIWYNAPGLASLLLLGALFAAGALVGAGFLLLKAPSRAGRKTMDQIEGFREYLSVAEEDRLNVLNPPEKTPELFERFLPYAVALDCQNAWAAKFAGVLAAAGTAAAAATWYVGTRDWRSDPVSFADHLGSDLSQTIASSANPPGSSDSGGGGGGGSSGGGSSGGGGGGGGGGGW